MSLPANDNKEWKIIFKIGNKTKIKYQNKIKLNQIKTNRNQTKLLDSQATLDGPSQNNGEVGKVGGERHFKLLKIPYKFQVFYFYWPIFFLLSI